MERITSILRIMSKILGVISLIFLVMIAMTAIAMYVMIWMKSETVTKEGHPLKVLLPY